MKGCYFVTGTDTEIGKTHSVCYLLQKYGRAGLTTMGLKPVAAGSDNGVNEDALMMKQYASLELPLDMINPFCFKEPCSPHISAKLESCELKRDEIVKVLKETLDRTQSDLCFIEGAGGWYAPLSDTISWKEVVQSMKLPVIFVVGMKLGCLNHAMLTEKALLADGIEVSGWIANKLSDNMPFYQDNLNTLNTHLSTPMLAEIPYGALLLKD